MGSLMIEENVVSAAGTVHYLTLQEMQDAIRELGYTPRRRNVFYEPVDETPVVPAHRYCFGDHALVLVGLVSVRHVRRPPCDVLERSTVGSPRSGANAAPPRARGQDVNQGFKSPLI